MKPISVGVVGLGCIGASLAWELKRKNFCREVLGHDLQSSSMDFALEKQIIDRAVSLEKCARDSDLVILAVPVLQIPLVAESLMPHLKSNSLLTDVGSAKDRVVKKIKGLLRADITFIGGHPMAGSEKSGVQAAKPALFSGAPYFLTPVKPINEQALNLLIDLIKTLGANPFLVTPEEHDAIVARISHLPYLVSAALVLSCGDDSRTTGFAAGGFRDTTRIASSDPVMGKDFCVANRKEIIRAAEKFISEIQDIIGRLSRGDSIEEKLRAARSLRDTIAAQKRWESDFNGK